MDHEKRVDDLSIGCAEMAHAFLLSPNPESKFGVTRVEGLDNPMPNLHDIGEKTVEDKRFSLL